MPLLLWLELLLSQGGGDNEDGGNAANDECPPPYTWLDGPTTLNSYDD